MTVAIGRVCQADGRLIIFSGLQGAITLSRRWSPVSVDS